MSHVQLKSSPLTILLILWALGVNIGPRSDYKMGFEYDDGHQYN